MLSFFSYKNAWTISRPSPHYIEPVIHFMLLIWSNLTQTHTESCTCAFDFRKCGIYFTPCLTLNWFCNHSCYTSLAEKCTHTHTRTHTRTHARTHACARAHTHTHTHTHTSKLCLVRQHITGVFHLTSIYQFILFTQHTLHREHILHMEHHKV